MSSIGDKYVPLSQRQKSNELATNVLPKTEKKIFHKNEYTEFDQMNSIEITNYLNSGKFIPIGVKKYLEEKSKDHKFDNLLEMKDVFKHIKVNSEPEKIIQDIVFNIVESRDTINYNTNTIKENIIEKKEPLMTRISNNYFEIDYLEIKQVIQKFNLHRLRLEYLILNLKIQFLTAICIVNQKKGSEFKKYFNYQQIIINEAYIAKIISLTMNFDIIFSIFDVINKIQNNKQDDLFKKYLTELENLFTKMMSINYLPDELEQYHEEISNILDDIEIDVILIRKKSENNDFDYEQRLSTSKKLLNKIYHQTLLRLNIECDYVIGAGIPLTPIAIHSKLTINYDDVIDLSCVNKNFYDSFLENITIEQFNSYFKKQKFDYSNYHFVTLLENGHFTDIYFEYNSHISIHRPIKITYLPAQVKVLYTYFNKPSIDNNHHLYPSAINKNAEWLRTSPHQVKISNTFNKLQENNRDINDGLYQSFVSLARETSF